MEATSSAATRLPLPRRVATEPTLLSASRRSLSVSSESARTAGLGGSRDPGDLVETLYNHPSVKIIAFTSSLRSPSTTPDGPEGAEAGILPASSQLERTIAVGPFRIYRAPGSVAFLSCGSALQPMLPKSQCWCIDEANSRYVLQIRRPQYWRIEVPVASPDDISRALILRDVLGKILLFEKTQCPFERTFTVALPEQPKNPVKKKPWTPQGKNLLSSPFRSDGTPAPPSLQKGNDRERARTDSEPPGIEPKETLDSKENTPTTLASSHDNQFIISSPGAGLADVSQSEHADETPVRWVATQISVINESATHEMPPRVVTDVPDQNQSAIKRSTGDEESRSVPNEKSTASQSPSSVSMGAQVSVEAHTAVPDPVEASKVSDPQVEAVKISATIPHDPSTEVSLVSDEVHEQEERGSASSPVEAEDKLGDEVTGEIRFFEGSGSIGSVNLKKKRMSRMLAGRSVTLPPQLTLVTSPPSKRSQLSLNNKDEALRDLPRAQQPHDSVETSPVGSTDSFHSIQSWHSPLTPLPPSPPLSSPSPPSFPYPHQNIIIPDKRQSRAEDTCNSATSLRTDGTLVPSSADATIRTLDTGLPGRWSPTESAVPDAIPAKPANRAVRPDASSGLPEIRHRGRPHNLSISRRALSPLPPAANLFSPPVRQRYPSRLEVVRKLPGAIIHKTVEILLSPPSHLVNLMLTVAAKIAAGEWRGLVLGFGEGGEKIPVQWDYSDGELSSWEDDDDYTFSMGRFARRQAGGDGVRAAANTMWAGIPPYKPDAERDRSWEVD